jgi:hypothetical protein
MRVKSGMQLAGSVIQFPSRYDQGMDLFTHSMQDLMKMLSAVLADIRA